MSLVSVPAMYDGEQVRLLEDAPVHVPYRVLVTFVEPAEAPVGYSERFLATFGAWQDERSAEEIIEVIKHTRLSKAEPPAL